MGKRTRTGDADVSGMTQIGDDSAVACLYDTARSTSLTAVRSEKFFRGKVRGCVERSVWGSSINRQGERPLMGAPQNSIT